MPKYERSAGVVDVATSRRTEDATRRPQTSVMAGVVDTDSDTADRASTTRLAINGSRAVQATVSETRVGDKIGYARISTAEQSLDLQIDALKAAGCTRVFYEEVSGAKTDRPELAHALDYVREGDVLVVWKLDRLGRSLLHLIDTVRALEERGVGFRSLQEEINTTSPGGRLVFHVLAALSEFERDLIRERTNAGLAAARTRGRRGGRPVVMTPKKIKAARQLYAAREHSVSEIALTLGVSRASVYRALADTPAELEEATS